MHLLCPEISFVTLKLPTLRIGPPWPVQWTLTSDIMTSWHTHLFCDAGLQRLLAAWAARAQVSPDSGSRRDYPHEMAASSHSVSLIKTQLSLCFMLRLVINFLKDNRFLALSGFQGVALCACLSRAIILHHYGPDLQATELCALRLSLKYIVLLYFYVFVFRWTMYICPSYFHNVKSQFVSSENSKSSRAFG